MAVKKETRDIFPLRKVLEVSVSEEMGEALGSRHYFWLNRRYTMTLECGHQQARVKANHQHLSPEELMPKSVRCKDCSTVSVPLPKAKPSPKYDHLATTLVGAILGVGGGPEEDKALSWVQEYGGWIDNEQTRASVYGAVAVFLLDAMLDDKVVRHSGALRTAIEDWASNPDDTTKETVRRTARRLYNTQGTPGNDWLAARALICLGRIASLGTQSARGVVEALTWDKTSRVEFYERLWAARHTVDYQASRGIIVAGLLLDADEREEALKQVAQETRDAKAELRRIWHDEYPKVGDHHLPLLLHLLAIYAEARDQGTVALAV